MMMDILLDLENKKIFLPILQKESEINFQKIERAKCDLSFPVSDDFCEVWLHGPQDSNSKKDITASLRIFAKELCDFIRIGQGITVVSEKNGPSDLVTEMDSGIEMLIRIWIKKYLPNHKIIGEEGSKDQITLDDYVWYIDPIDGTSNYIKKIKNVTLHLCCLYQGKPYITVVGLPFYDELFVEDEISLGGLTLADENLIGTEYKASLAKDNDIYKRILSELDAKPYRVNCIGINLLGFLNNKSVAFYKNHIKIWDLIAPAALLYFLAKDVLDIKIFIPKDNGDVTQENMLELDLFSNSPEFVARLNSEHLGECRIGLVLVTPKERPKVRKVILNEFISA
jgi:fructose-1,6-bisphosphatase/inositol monophosphatase family enzyme